MKVTALILLIAGCVLVTGCYTRLCDLTVVSTKTVQLQDLDLEGVDRAMNVTGTSYKQVFFIVPTGTADIEEAIDNALDKASGDLMVDAVVYWKYWYIPLIYGQFGFKVTGHVVKTKSWTTKLPPQ
ncbi:MAG: hypothetical protein ABIH04_01945 [Planctomycetota bacterium]